MPDKIAATIVPEDVDDECQDCPVLDGYRDGICLMTWCDHERRWHQHGVCDGTCPSTLRLGLQPGRDFECPPGSADGHRVAHCGCRHSPYREDGYRVREVGPFTPEVEGSHRPVWAECRCCPTQRRYANNPTFDPGDRCDA